MAKQPYENEAAMVACFLAQLKKSWSRYPYKNQSPWTVYPETGGWDLMLVHADGYQIGIEAKLSLNPKVISQALCGQHRERGPDYRAVLVPTAGCQLHMDAICSAIGIAILRVTPPDKYGYGQNWQLPNQGNEWSRDWSNWCPAERIKLPAYVPDCEAGKPSPITLTDWKIRAIKLCIILERRGHVTRADMTALSISQGRWTDLHNGLLDRSNIRGVFVAGKHTPNFRTEHPRNYVEIEADAETWLAELKIDIQK